MEPKHFRKDIITIYYSIDCKLVLRGVGEKHENKLLFFIVLNTFLTFPRPAGEGQQAAVIVFKATALHRANAGIEPISGLVCIG